MTVERGNKESGQSLVEAAIVLPLLILCFNAIVEIGWVIYNRVDFDNMTVVAVRANSKDDEVEAEDFMTQYIKDNYKGYDAGSITLDVDTEVKEFFYDEYVYKINQRKHWKVPMYFKVLYTQMKITNEVQLLTPFGSVIFGGSSITMHANSIAVRAMENDSIASLGGG